MKPNLPHTEKRQRAQAMIEFALVFPLLVLLMYSLLEFGRLLFIYISVINSSREAARYGSSVGNPTAYRYVDCDGIINAARRSAILNTIQPEDISITYDLGDSPNYTTMFGGAQCGSSAVDPAEIKSPNRVNVQVTLTYSPIMPVQWASFPITARSARTIIKSVEVAGENVGELGTPSVQFTSAGGETFDEGTVHQVALVMLGGTATFDVTVGLEIEAVTADASDISMPMTVTFLANEQYKTIDVSLLADLCDEVEIETLRLKIKTVPTGVLKGYPLTYTINIRDIDPTPTLFFESASSSRSENASPAPVNVRLSAPSCQAVTFSYAAQDLSATLNVDYTLPSMPFTIDPGMAGITTLVSLVNDELYETDEQVRFTLNIPTDDGNAEPGMTPQHTLTILNDDPKPVISFDLATSISSETVGQVILYARMDRFSAIPAQVTLSVNPAGTTANAQDYQVATGVLTIPPGEREAEIVITIFNNDTIPEGDETVELRLSNPVDADLGSPSVHVLTIREEASPPQVSFLSAGVSRDESFGTTIARLVLSEATNQNVTINYSVGGTASAGFDYVGPTPTSVVIKAGALSADILVTIIDDPYDEADETIVLSIVSASNATISGTGPTSHTILILDNDDPPVVSFASAGSTVEEGSSLSITVSLSKPSNLPVSVAFSLSGTAPSGDYTILTASPLTFAPGATSQAIQVSLTDDSLYTGSRELVFSLTSPVNATLGSQTVYTLIIQDNEVCPTLTGWTREGKNAYTTVSLPVEAPAIQLTSMTITQQSGQQLRQVDLGAGNTIFQGSLSGSPVTITNFKNNADLIISGPAGGKVMVLSFQDLITITDAYSVELVWSNACTVRKP
jgi:Flp pilus assembly protein TadG